MATSSSSSSNLSTYSLLPPSPDPFAPLSYGNSCRCRHVEHVSSIHTMVLFISRSSTPVDCRCLFNLACTGAIADCLCISVALLLPCSCLAAALPLMMTTIAAVNDHHRCYHTVDDNNRQKPAVVICHQWQQWRPLTTVPVVQRQWRLCHSTHRR